MLMESLPGTSMILVGPSGIQFWVTYTRREGFTVVGDVQEQFSEDDIHEFLDRLVGQVTSLASFAVSGLNAEGPEVTFLSPLGTVDMYMACI